MIKYALILGVTLLSGTALAAGAPHGALSNDNPHTNSGCASKKGKVSQFHQFHNKENKMTHAEKKMDLKAMKKANDLRDSI